jgi:HK97 family phage prohead protease
VSAVDAYAVWLGVKYGRYDLAHDHVRAALDGGRRRRSAALASDVRRRSAGTATVSGDGVVVGHASIFGNEYGVGYGVMEKVRAGAWAESIRAQGGVAPVFYEHDWNNPIGAALVSEDRVGLRAEATLFVTSDPKAMSVYRAAQANAITAWSLGFIPEVVEVSERDGVTVEEIVRAELLEVSLVVRGANPAAQTTEVRSA